METTYLTKEKHIELVEELSYLKNKRRKEIADKLEYARSLGDLSENAEYHEARQQQAETEARVRDLEYIIKTASIVSHTKSTIVEIGSTVTLQKEGGSAKTEYTIVGSQEADMSAGRISHTSPLGAALIGHNKGEIFVFNAPSGTKISYKIVNVV